MAKALSLLYLVALTLLSSVAQAETLTDRVHAALLQLPPWHGAKDDPNHGDASEDPQTRSERLHDVAAAVSSGVLHTMCQGAWKDDPNCDRRWKGSRRQLTAAVVSIGYWETAYASAIPLGRCDLLPGGCDRDRNGNARARSFWQCWRSACPNTWTTEPGSDAELRTAAWEAANLLAGFYVYCQTLGREDPWELAFTAYAGRGCKPWDVAKRRRATMAKLLTKF